MFEHKEVRVRAGPACAAATRSQPGGACLEWHATTGEGEAGMPNGWTAWMQTIPPLRSASRGGGAEGERGCRGSSARPPARSGRRSERNSSSTSTRKQELRLAFCAPRARAARVRRAEAVPRRGYGALKRTLWTSGRRVALAPPLPCPPGIRRIAIAQRQRDLGGGPTRLGCVLAGERGADVVDEAALARAFGEQAPMQGARSNLAVRRGRRPRPFRVEVGPVEGCIDPDTLRQC